MPTDAASFYGLCVCRNCGDDYMPSSEDDDICYSCHIAPIEEGAQDGEYTCMNCGAHYTYSPAGPSGFCSNQCAQRAHHEITTYGRFY